MACSFRMIPIVATLFLGGGCGGGNANESASNGMSEPPANSAAAFAWPDSLRPLGDGYPDAGDPCRRLGESESVANYLDDSADLVGCPGPTDGAVAQAIVQGRNGRVVDDLGGVAIISVPRGDSGTGEGAPDQRSAADGDALVPGTNFNATGSVRCVTSAGQAPRDCEAGVVRNRDGTAIVTISWPDGRSRGLFFGAGGALTGADTSQADGSARYQPTSRRDNDTIIVTLGPERYEIPDVLVAGD